MKVKDLIVALLEYDMDGEVRIEIGEPNSGKIMTSDFKYVQPLKVNKATGRAYGIFGNMGDHEDKYKPMLVLGNT